jgi:CBS domain-containing protein
MESISKGFDGVPPDTSVEQVIQRITRDAAARSVFVVDEQGGLLGIIHVREILRLLGARYAGGSFSSPREFMARTARDIMGPAHAVDVDDDLETALRIAVQNEVYDIPVLDNGRVVANLDCLELIVNVRPHTSR